MPPQFCPISFTLFPSIKQGGEKNIFRFDAHQRGTQTPHQVVLITAIRPSQRCMPMTSIIRPHGCRLMHSRQALLSSTPLRESLTSPPSLSLPFHRLNTLLALFSCPPLPLWCIHLPHIHSSALFSLPPCFPTFMFLLHFPL